MRSRLLIAAGLVICLAGSARADDFKLLKGCIETANAACLERVGEKLTAKIPDPRQKSLMLARFGLIDWAGGNYISGDTKLIRAWSLLRQVPNQGCLPRVEATFQFEDLTSVFGHRLASRLVLRNLVSDAAHWPAAQTPQCERPAAEPHWLARVAERQDDLGDADGLSATLELALRWALDPKMSGVDFAPRAEEAASLLAAHGRAGDAIRICDANRSTLLGALGAAPADAAQADALWQALSCYRAAGLTQGARATYQEFAAAKLKALGLATLAASGEADAFGPAIWSLVKDISWTDPMLTAAPADEAVPSPRECFERPSASCLSVHAMEFVDAAKHGQKRKSADMPDFKTPGSLDGFAHFLVGANGDPVGDEARAWFLDQAGATQLQDLKGLVRDAVKTGDFIWARRIFYSWYQAGGEAFFRHLAHPDAAAQKEAQEESWPLHVAWTIALTVNDLGPAFEPEEMAEFGETAWDDGISQLPPLRDIPRVELVDSDERAGQHLLNLCFREAFGQWAAELFTHAHVPERAVQARALLPEAARDCAFARRSVGPLLMAAGWFVQQGDQKSARALFAEAADRLTRPHYHVYEDADPNEGGAALAAMALGLDRGLLVPSPYQSVF